MSAGVEVECHILKITRSAQQPCRLHAARDAARRRGVCATAISTCRRTSWTIWSRSLRRIRHALIGVGLPLRILDAEMGPAQFEISLDPLENMAAADAVIMLRGAVKQVCRRMGLLASFMSKPALPNVYSSGWHLHQSLFHTATDKNAFAEAGVLMSETGLHFVGGLLEHAHASTAFSNPTVNGYKTADGQSPGAKAGGLVARQQGCDVPAGRRHGRSGDAYREPIRRAGGQPVSLHGLADRRRPGRNGKQD